MNYHKNLTPDQIDEFEERAAIIEYDSGIDRNRAEYIAYTQITRQSPPKD